MKSLPSRFITEDEGQDLIEYALLAGLIALLCVVAITNAGQKCRPCSSTSRPPFLEVFGMSVNSRPVRFI